jgi:drug/metabolite transporter (DMT)-like permease
VRELVSAALEVAAIVLLATAAAMAGWQVWPPLGAALAAAVLLGASYVLSREPRRATEEG